MLVVLAQLISARDGSGEDLGRIHICNDGTGTETRGNYKVELYSRGPMESARVVREIELHNWPRKAKTAMQLVMQALIKLENLEPDKWVRVEVPEYTAEQLIPLYNEWCEALNNGCEVSFPTWLQQREQA